MFLIFLSLTGLLLASICLATTESFVAKVVFGAMCLVNLVSVLGWMYVFLWRWQ